MSTIESDDGLGRLTEELEVALRAGEPYDLDALCDRHGVEREEGRRVLDALEALGLALGEDPGGGDAPELPPPTLPDDYELKEEIGRGGMGVVYRAWQRSLDRAVAVKVLRPGELLFAEAIRRFQNEAKSLARLKHRHIVSVHEVGEAGGNVFYSMDLIQGGSLADALRTGAWTPARTVRLMRQVTSAIAYTHSHDLIHRDLKPANILIDDDGDAFVVDFGLARDCAIEGDLTASGHILGTPDYMSPEQARGDTRAIGEGTDIYALGAILYECLTGRAPFADLSLAEKIHAVVNVDPVPARKLDPKVPRDLETICMKAMSKEPERRYTAASALLEDLERFADGRTIRGKKPGVAYRATRFFKQNVSAVLTVALLILAFVAAQLWIVQPRMGETPETKLANARQLEEQGAVVGARITYGEALALAEDRDAEEELIDELRRSLVRSRLLVARDHFDLGRVDEGTLELKTAANEIEAALDELAETEGGDAWKNDPDVALERAVFCVLEGDVEEAYASLAESHRTGRNSLRLLLELVEPALLHEEAPGHAAAADFFALAMRHGGQKATAEWLATRGDAGLALFNAGFEAIDELEPLDQRVFLTSLIETSREWLFPLHDAFGPGLTSVFSRRAFGPFNVAAPGPVDAAACWFVTVLADLPFRPVLEDGLPVCDESTMVRVGKFFTQTEPRTRVQAFHDEVRRAFEELAELSPGERELTLEWLERNVGTSDASWWSANSQRSPVDWLTDAVGEAERDDLIERFLVSEGSERHRLHRLLSLTSRDTDPVPSRPVLADGFEPDGLAMEWYRRSSRWPGESETYTLRLAHFSVDTAQFVPQVLWTHVQDVAIGADFTLTRAGVEAEVVRPVKRSRLYLTDLDRPSMIDGALGIRPLDVLDVRAKFEWRGSKLALWVHDAVCHVSTRGRGGNDANGFPSEDTRLEVDRVAVLNVTEPGGRPDRMHFTLAHLQVAEGAADEWQLQDWSAALYDDAMDFLDRVESDDAGVIEDEQEWRRFWPFGYIWGPTFEGLGRRMRACLENAEAVPSGEAGRFARTYLGRALVIRGVEPLGWEDEALAMNGATAFWTRVLAKAKHGGYSNLATGALAELAKGVEGREPLDYATLVAIGDAVETRRYKLSGELSWFIETARDRMGIGGTWITRGGFFAGVLVAILFIVVRALIVGPRSRLLGAAAGLPGVGWICTLLVLEFGPWAVDMSGVGMFMLAFGAYVLGRELDELRAYKLFLLAGVLAILAQIAFPVCVGAMRVAAALGLLSLKPIYKRLRAMAPPRRGISWTAVPVKALVFVLAPILIAEGLFLISAVTHFARVDDDSMFLVLHEWAEPVFVAGHITTCFFLFCLVRVGRSVEEAERLREHRAKRAARRAAALA